MISRAPFRSRLPSGREPVGCRSADQHAVSPERKRLYDIGASPEAAIDEQAHRASNPIRDLRQDVHRRNGAIELAAAMVAEHDRVGPKLARPQHIPDGQQALDDEFSGPEGPQPGDESPIDIWVHLTPRPRRCGGNAALVRREEFSQVAKFRQARQEDVPHPPCVQEHVERGGNGWGHRLAEMRRSHSRLPKTDASTVKTSASQPAA